MTITVLEVRQLATAFSTELGFTKVVDNVSFSLKKGQTLGIVGESGCGKSVTSLSIMGLLPRPHGQVVEGEILFDGQDLTKIPKEQYYKIRGKRISMIFQEPMTALNPVYTVGMQLGEVYKLHFSDWDQKRIWTESIVMLKKVGIPSPERRLREYPYQLSGGMRQRIMIAMALACSPDILIADEPTTALDVTIQAQILDLMRDLQSQNDMAILFITHDLGVIAEMAHEVLVMYAGRGAEQAASQDLFRKPCHPYTRGLLASIPRLTSKRKTRLETIPGMVPALHEMPVGCRFANRCQFADQTCRDYFPDVSACGVNHVVRCHHWQKVRGHHE